MTEADPFINPTAAAILRTLYENPHREWYQRELVHHLRRSQSTIEYEMQKMVAAGVVSGERRGRKVLYKPHPMCSIHEELRAILLKTYGVTDELREMLLRFNKNIDWAFIRDEGLLTLRSDLPIRVHLIGTLDFDNSLDFDDECQKIRSRVDRTIKFEREHRSDFDPAVRTRETRVNEIIRCKKIWLIGNEKRLLNLARQKIKQRSNEVVSEATSEGPRAPARPPRSNKS